MLRQWGRGQTAAESLTNEADGNDRNVASMGPRPDGRGKGIKHLNPLYFVAASMGPRPDGRGKPYPCGLCMSACGVNGAAARRPRKVAPLPEKDVGRVVASMGPRPDGRGKNVAGQVEAGWQSRQWGRGQTAAERS